MSLNIVKTTGGGRIPIIQKVIELAQGGFILDVTGLPSSGTVKKGTPVIFSESTRKAKVVKTAVMQAAATDSATALKVLKGSYMAVGNVIAAISNGAKYAVTAIDTSNGAYDQLTVGTTLGVALSAGDVIFVASGTAGADGAALENTPNGILYEDTPIDGNEPLSVLIRGTVYKRRIPNGVHALVQAALEDNIIFSSSY